MRTKNSIPHSSLDAGVVHITWNVGGNLKGDAINIFKVQKQLDLNSLLNSMNILLSTEGKTYK